DPIPFLIHLTMVVLGTVANSPYSRLLKGSGNIYFDIAPYPPVQTSLFNIGSVFSLTANGQIVTCDDIPSIVSSPFSASLTLLWSGNMRDRHMSLQFSKP